MATLACRRVSASRQDIDNQHLELANAGWLHYRNATRHVDDL